MLTTLPNVQEFGPEVEAHPGQRVIMHLLGPSAGTIIGKVYQVVAVVVVAALWRPWCPWIMLLAGVSYSLGALSNHMRWL